MKSVKDRKSQWFTVLLKCVLKHDFQCFGYEKKDVICSRLKKNNKRNVKPEKLEVMKNLNYVTILVVGFLFVAISASAADVRTEFKEYEITSVEDIHVGKSIKAIWTVSYSNNETPVTVVKRKTVDGIEYVVQSNHFAVSYLASAAGFGAKEVRKSWSSVPKRITDAVICKQELANQAIITPNSVNDERALKLIASYLPDLLNDGYTHLLN